MTGLKVALYYVYSGRGSMGFCNEIKVLWLNNGGKTLV